MYFEVPYICTYILHNMHNGIKVFRSQICQMLSTLEKLSGEFTMWSMHAAYLEPQSGDEFSFSFFISVLSLVRIMKSVFFGKHFPLHCTYEA